MAGFLGSYSLCNCDPFFNISITFQCILLYYICPKRFYDLYFSTTLIPWGKKACALDTCNSRKAIQKQQQSANAIALNLAQLLIFIYLSLQLTCFQLPNNFYIVQYTCEAQLTTRGFCRTIDCNYFNSNTFPYRTDILNAVFYNKQLSGMSSRYAYVLYHYCTMFNFHSKSFIRCSKAFIFPCQEEIRFLVFNTILYAKEIGENRPLNNLDIVYQLGASSSL